MTAPAATPERIEQAPDPVEQAPDPVEQLVARLLSIGTVIAIGLLVVGSALLALRGGSALDTAPSLDVTAIPGDLVAGRPEGYLWLGLIAAIATPCARVAASLAGYVRRRERAMAVISVMILAVIALTVALAGSAQP
jgi:uncharacterized membrane protein